MIRTEREYREAQRRMQQDQAVATKQRAALVAAGLSPDEIVRAMEPLLSFHAQLQEEVEWYQRVQKRDFQAVSRLTGIGRLLIALRIAGGLSQRDLARRLGVSEAQVSRDERDEYYSITLERAQRILDAIGETLITQVADREARRDTVAAR